MTSQRRPIDRIHAVPFHRCRAPEMPAWFLDDFDPRDLLPVRLWRHAAAIRYVVGLVATTPAFCPRGRKEHRGWVPLRWAEVKTLFGRSGTWNEIRRLLLDR